ncbi:hypothetical protein F5Y15DRAFT_63269 [Xylariaceae sp. FL0016]|nr:hypothetical protein F5Y15DRAFT_63269 [Xylariaceae sp. FL0016]
MPVPQESCYKCLATDLQCEFYHAPVTACVQCQELNIPCGIPTNDKKWLDEGVQTIRQAGLRSCVECASRDDACVFPDLRRPDPCRQCIADGVDCLIPTLEDAGTTQAPEVNVEDPRMGFASLVGDGIPFSSFAAGPLPYFQPEQVSVFDYGGSAAQVPEAMPWVLPLPMTTPSEARVLEPNWFAESISDQLSSDMDLAYSEEPGSDWSVGPSSEHYGSDSSSGPGSEQAGTDSSSGSSSAEMYASFDASQIENSADFIWRYHLAQNTPVFFLRPANVTDDKTGEYPEFSIYNNGAWGQNGNLG